MMVEQFKLYKELDKWFSGTPKQFGYRLLRQTAS